MNIVLKHKASVGDLHIPPGEYLVALQSERNQILLTGHGMDIALPATKRPSRKKVRITEVLFYSMGGPIWTLSIAEPKRGEWAVFLKLERN
ncbi:MAG: hypothetical protein NDJ90_02010 [Oligoflexia bacterium]|nr:hypothetical protein [Oligoflexia bacterium]